MTHTLQQQAEAAYPSIENADIYDHCLKRYSAVELIERLRIAYIRGATDARVAAFAYIEENMKGWHDRNDPPKIEGVYLVEVSISDDNSMGYDFDYYKNGRWDYAQFVSRWLDISHRPEFKVLTDMHKPGTAGASATEGTGQPKLDIRDSAILEETISVLKWMMDTHSVDDKNLQSDSFNRPANAITGLEYILGRDIMNDTSPQQGQLQERLDIAVKALGKIAQMSDPGSPIKAIVDMKAIATEALAKINAPAQSVVTDSEGQIGGGC